MKGNRSLTAGAGKLLKQLREFAVAFTGLKPGVNEIRAVIEALL